MPTGDITSNRPPGVNDLREFKFHRESVLTRQAYFGHSNESGMKRVAAADRVVETSTGKLAYRLQVLKRFPICTQFNQYVE